MTGIDQLLAVLDLERTGEDGFRGRSLDPERPRVFGGEVMAQALVAATRTVDPERRVHSLHAYFLRPGDPKEATLHAVDRLRDGGSFTTRRVVARQRGEAIFALSASFQLGEEGFDHQAEMPDVPRPNDLPAGAELARLLAGAPETVRRYWARPRPVEFRPVSLERYLATGGLPPEHRIWVRAAGPVGPDPALNAAVLAYLSDMTLLDTALFAHGRSVFADDIQAASLDHAMWFHRPTDVGEWHLYAQDSPSASGGRGLSRGALFRIDGTLVATVAQEGLIRPRRPKS